MDTAVRLWRRARALDPIVEDGALGTGLLAVSAWGLATPGLLSAAVPALHSPPPAPGLIPLAALIIAPVAVRRRRPLAGFVLQVVAWALAALLTNRLGISLAAVAAIVVGAYSTGAYSARRAASLATVVAGSLLLDVGRTIVIDAVMVTLANLVLVTAWLAGTSLRDHRQRIQRERELAARAAVAEERASIARELHDVVAHGVTVMVVQAEAARRVLGRDQERAATALRTISSTGSEALDELERLLHVLAAGEEAEVQPAPGLDGLESLLARVRAAGVPVELRQDGERRALPRGLEVTAYRVIQEALTNVLKHGGGAAAVVRLEYGADRLDIEVIDDGRAVVPAAAGTSGRGLVGMRERLAAFGGQLQAGPRPEGGYAVRARLPLGESG